MVGVAWEVVGVAREGGGRGLDGWWVWPEQVGMGWAEVGGVGLILTLPRKSFRLTRSQSQASTSSASEAPFSSSKSNVSFQRG